MTRADKCFRVKYQMGIGAGPPGEAAAACWDGRGRWGVPHSEAETEQPKVTEHTLKQDYLSHATAKHSKVL